MVSMISSPLAMISDRERPLAGDKVSACSSPIVVPQGVVSGCFCPHERRSDIRKMAMISRIIRIIWPQKYYFICTNERKIVFLRCFITIINKMLRIAVQSKGRLFDDTMNLLSEADIKVSASKRTLLVQASNFPLEVLYLRDDDIPQSVANGVADIGIVGENEFVEHKERAQVIQRLGFSKCRLSLAIPKEIKYTGVSWFNDKKIATSYPNILRDYLHREGVNADVHVITGSVEISPGIGLADGIFDIVSSGSTLVSNNLKEVEVVMQSEALLIGNWNMDEEKHEILNEMLFRFEAVRSAQGKKYVMMNAPKDKLEAIAHVLPGIKSPTIIPLADPAWCSIHTVLDEKRFWEIIGKLKELGAQGILVTPIEKMIL